MNAAQYLECATLPNGVAPHWHHVAHVCDCGVLFPPLDKRRRCRLRANVTHT